MSITLKFRAGKPALLIPDADGEAHGYSFRIARQSTGRAWVCRFTKLTSGAKYHVAAYPDGVWTCDCADSTFRGYNKRDKECCKHVRSARELQQLALCLVAQDEEIQGLLEEAKLLFGDDSTN